MELLATDADGVQTLRLVGNFEPTDVGRFESKIRRAIEGGCVRVVVDATDVQLVCSAALSAFLRAHVELRSREGDLVMAGLPSFAMELFETLGLDRRIPCYATVDLATEAFLH
jgi:anti-anti-sigma factor